MVFTKKNLLATTTILLAMLTLSACEESKSASADNVKGENITTLNEELNLGSAIMVDEKTGVEYILIRNNGGITPRIDKNGKPVINQQWLKKHEKKELKKKVNRELQKFTVHN
ncbi:MAG: DUF6440 family protein [Lactobacillus crispatus]|nr:DUF6440 family protein [Lactobacillus crispatus]